MDQPSSLHVIRLKQKLGTKQLPTGELLLDGMNAELISQPGRGVSSISHMLNITRLHNAAGSVSGMRRLVTRPVPYTVELYYFYNFSQDHKLSSGLQSQTNRLWQNNPQPSVARPYVSRYGTGM